MLVLVAFFWGSSCPFTKIALEDLDEFNLIAIRFLIGFALAALFLFRKLKTDIKTIGYAAAISLNYFCVLALMTFGVRYTTASRAGFLTCLACVFVPMICVLFFRAKLERKIVFCSVTTLIGIYLLTMGGEFGGIGINLGDILCTLCSLFFAIHIMLISFAVKRVDAITLAAWQMGFVSVYNIIASFIFESPHLPTTGFSWLNVFWLGAICSVSAAILQNTAQKHTSETHAGIIFTLEPVFAMIISYYFLSELLTFWGYIGAAILLASIVLLELRWK